MASLFTYVTGNHEHGAKIIPFYGRIVWNKWMFLFWTMNQFFYTGRSIIQLIGLADHVFCLPNDLLVRTCNDRQKNKQVYSWR